MSVKRSMAAAAWRLADAVVRTTRARASLADALFVQGSPRSGTTWFMELLAVALDRLPLSEPFHQRKVADVAGRVGLTARPYRRPGTVDPELDRFLGLLLQGRFLRPGYLSRKATTPGRLVRFVAGAPVTVNAIRAAFLLPYLCERFPEVNTVLLVRNPRAVVASQLGYPMKPQPPDVLAPVLDDHPELQPRRTPASVVEGLAVQWCIEHRFLLAHAVELERTLVVRYDDMVRAPEPTLRRVVDLVGARWDDRVLARVDDPSKHVKASSAFLHGDPLEGYRRQLSSDDLAIVERVLDEYDHPFDY